MVATEAGMGDAGVAMARGAVEATAKAARRVAARTAGTMAWSGRGRGDKRARGVGTGSGVAACESGEDGDAVRWRRTGASTRSRPPPGE